MCSARINTLSLLYGKHIIFPVVFALVKKGAVNFIVKNVPVTYHCKLKRFYTSCGLHFAAKLSGFFVSIFIPDEYVPFFHVLATPAPKW